MKHFFLCCLIIINAGITHCRDNQVKDTDKTSAVNPAIADTVFMVLKEGIFCGDLIYDKDLHWYGIYKTGVNGTEELKSADIEIVMRDSLNEDQAMNIFGEDNMNAGYMVRTGSERSSVFLFGSEVPLEETRFRSVDFEGKGFGGFLYPEQRESIFIPGYNELWIQAKELIRITDSAAYLIERKYEIELTDIDRSSRARTLQNITDDITFTGYPASLHAGHYSPRIIWCGDIDNDHKFDLLIYSEQMRESGDNLGVLILFLSSRAGKGEITGKAAEWYFKVSCEG